MVASNTALQKALVHQETLDSQAADLGQLMAANLSARLSGKRASLQEIHEEEGSLQVCLQSTIKLNFGHVSSSHNFELSNRVGKI